MKNNSSELPDKIRELIANNKLNINELNYIVVTIGPGSYTGIRVGLSLAQGLAYSLNIPLLPINTIDVLCSLAYEENSADKVIALPAYQDKLLHFTISSVNSNEKPNLELSKIESFEGVTVHGIGLDRYEDRINYKKLDFTAQSIGQYAINHYKLLCCENIGDITPIYLDEFSIS